MDKLEIETILIEIFSDVLKLDSREEILVSSMDDHEKWDSLALVRIVTAMEDEFELLVQADEALKLKSFSLCQAYISEKIANKA